jgi:hypothetical protein
MKLEGGCLCGRVRYAIDGPILTSDWCHCRLCQRSAGAPAVAWLTVTAGNFRYTKGEPRTFASTAKGRRQFCGDCGTQLVFFDGEVERDITIASLDEPAQMPPQDHIWTMSQLPFVKLEDGLPRHRERRPSR